MKVIMNPRFVQNLFIVSTKRCNNQAARFIKQRIIGCVRLLSNRDPSPSVHSFSKFSINPFFSKNKKYSE